MKRKISLVIVSILVISIKTLCQKLPTMFVPKTIAENRISQFTSGTTSKYQQLKVKLANLNASFMYTNAEMNMLLSKIVSADGLRIYFAIYNDCIPYTLPSGVKKNKIILLFSPGYQDSKPDEEKFFFIDENDNKDSVYQIDNMDCIRQWTTNYYSDVIQNILRKRLIPNDPDNVDQSIPDKYFDTKSIFYQKDFLKEAITTEQTYTHVLKTGQKVNIDYFKFSIASFDNVGQFPPDASGHRWRNRLLLNIDYMYKTGTQKNVFHFEDLINFDDRLNQSLASKSNFSDKQLEKLSRKEKLKILRENSLDNGQLCPTYCPK